DDGDAPARVAGSESRLERVARVRVRGAARRPKRRSPLAAIVRDEEIGPAVLAVVLGGNAHAGVRVCDSPRLAGLDEVEAEPSARLVQVEPVRVEVVGDVEVWAPVAVHVREHSAEAVVEPGSVDPGLDRNFLEVRMPVAVEALVEV